MSRKTLHIVFVKGLRIYVVTMKVVMEFVTIKSIDTYIT